MPQPPSVYRIHSTVELPLDDLYDYFETADLPDEIADLELDRRNNTLLVSSVAAADDIPRYTPTAQLKATVFEKRVYETPPEERAQGPWLGDDEEPIPSELVEFAGFKGKGEEVLLHSALQYPMFEVLREVARRADQGELTAITAVDGELRAVCIVDGQERDATVELTEAVRAPQPAGAQWRDFRADD